MNIREWCDEGRQRWPRINLSAEAFATFVSERIDEQDSRNILVSDLYFACACWKQDEAAMREFTEVFAADINRVAQRASAPGVSTEDARQMLLERILVGTDRSPPKIGSYRGRGSLRAWVRVTAIRLLIDIFRSGQSKERSVDQSLFDEISHGEDPEVLYLKKHYGEQFRRAFETAVAALEPKTRNWLRHLFIERLTIDQLAALYSIHRSTAARRLANARSALLAETRNQLIHQLKIEGSEIDSIMRLIDSRFELSVQRIFQESARQTALQSDQ